jgi:nucleoside-diphosphate-sugar epimerase
MMAATRAVAEAAGRLSLPLVHLSSMAVYGAHAGRIDEAAPLRGTGGYAEAKIECESALAGTEAVILRPGIVYGPGGEQWAGRIFRLLRARRLGDLGENGDGRCNFVHARDVGAAVIAALGTPSAAGRAINLAHDCAPRWNTVFAACARAIGAVPVPRIAAWQLAAEARVLAPPLFLARHAAGRFSPCSLRVPDAITPSMCSLFRGDFTLDAGLANRLLGLAWVPPAEGLGECATWFLEAHGFPMAV